MRLEEPAETSANHPGANPHHVFLGAFVETHTQRVLFLVLRRQSNNRLFMVDKYTLEHKPRFCSIPFVQLIPLCYLGNQKRSTILKMHRAGCSDGRKEFFFSFVFIGAQRGLSVPSSMSVAGADGDPNGTSASRLSCSERLYCITPVEPG